MGLVGFNLTRYLFGDYYHPMFFCSKALGMLIGVPDFSTHWPYNFVCSSW